MRWAMSRVLVVDDVESNLYLLEKLLAGYGHEVSRAIHGLQALELARKSPPDLVISDILMPVMDGFTLCREWRRDERLKDIPFVFYTATYTDPKDERFALELGANRFIVKPTDPAQFMEILREVLRQHRYGALVPSPADSQPDEVFLREYNEALVRKLEDKLQQLDQLHRALEESYRKLDRILLQTVNALASAMTQRDAYTAAHQQRCANLAVAIAGQLGVPEHQIDGLRVAALLHDIGKLAIPAEVLVKPKALSEIEWALIRSHVESGYEIVRKIDFPWPVADIVLQHHERLDGSGYPRGLSAAQILPESRILAVADVVEAMMSHRPYRPARRLEQTLEEILQNRSRLYDADVVDACHRLASSQSLPL
jgi:putative nucleotidyltransferase with HDIG domain